MFIVYANVYSRNEKNNILRDFFQLNVKIF